MNDQLTLQAALGSPAQAASTDAVTDFSNEFRALLAERGMSLRQAARQVPCDSGYLSRLTRGRKVPSPRMAARLEEVLDASGRLACRIHREPDGPERRRREPPRAARGNPVVLQWTGREIRALRLALRLTNEEFAAHLGVAARTVSKWNTHPGLVTVPELQRALDTVLDQAPAPARERFALALTAGEHAWHPAIPGPMIPAPSRSGRARRLP